LKTRGARTTDTVIALLDQRMARPITTAEQVITAVIAPKDVRLHIGASARGAVLRVDRLYKDEAGNAVELAISHFLPEHYSYRVTLRRNPR
jgi:DNA-binding GntR family transcriptional regulator